MGRGEHKLAMYIQNNIMLFGGRPKRLIEQFVGSVVVSLGLSYEF